jgi:hypothetical protein
MTAQQDLNVEALRLMSLQCSLQRRALAMVLGAVPYYHNILCNWERSCPRQLGTLGKLIRPVIDGACGRLISSLVRALTWSGIACGPGQSRCFVKSQPARGWTQLAMQTIAPLGRP